MRKKSSRFGLRRMSARIAWTHRPGQRPPLRAEARLEPGREAPADPERASGAAAESHLGEVLGLVVEDVPEAPALRAPAAGDPALVLGLDELAPGVLDEEALEARHRPAGQAGAREQDHVVGLDAPRPRSGRARSAAPRRGRSCPSGRRRASRPGRCAARRPPPPRAPRSSAAGARTSKWMKARASRAAATRVRASSAACSGRSWARIRNRSFIAGGGCRRTSEPALEIRRAEQCAEARGAPPAPDALSPGQRAAAATAARRPSAEQRPDHRGDPVVEQGSRGSSGKRQ